MFICIKMVLRCWLEHGNITKQIQFKYKRNLKEIHVFAARTYTQTQAQSCKQEMKKYTHSRLLAFALAFTSHTCISMLQHYWKGKVLFRFVSPWIGGPVEWTWVSAFFFFFFCFSHAEIPYLAEVDESLDLVTELETSEFHDQFHQQSALRAQSQN